MPDTTPNPDVASDGGSQKPEEKQGKPVETTDATNGVKSGEEPIDHSVAGNPPNDR